MTDDLIELRMSDLDEHRRLAAEAAWDRCVAWFATKPQRIQYAIGEGGLPIRYPIVNINVLNAAEEDNPYQKEGK